MSLTSEHELEIRKAIADKISLVAESGFVIPAPVYFVDKADFWANIGNLTTQKLIERTNINFCVVSLLGFADTELLGSVDQPLVTLNYNFYLFRQYSYERQDQSGAPDEFLKKTLKSYNTFIKAVLDVRNQFLGINPLISIEGFEVNSKSLIQSEFIRENDICRYVPDITGHSVDLQGRIEILVEDC